MKKNDVNDRLMKKEFEEYWATHQKRLILNAPERMRKELLEAGRLDSPTDWLCFVIPIGVGIIVQPLLKLHSEILSWGIVFVIVVAMFVVMQMVKPHFTKKKSELQVMENIKKYYYERFKEIGDLDKLEPWRD